MPLQSCIGESREQRRLLELRALRLQVREMTSALATGEVAALLERLAALELGCAAFGTSLRESVSTARSLSDCQAATPELAGQIQNEHLELARLSYRFSALLRRRRRSVELLLRHYQSISRGSGPVSDNATTMQRISAEA